MDPRHTDPKLKIGLSGVGGAGPTRSEKEKWMMDAMGDAVVEAWTLAETDYKVITEQSGFGKIGKLSAHRARLSYSEFETGNWD